MSKRFFGIFVSLLVVAMLTLTMSEAFATKSETVTAQRAMKYPPMPTRVERDVGKSGDVIANTVAEHKWTGDIVGICDTDAMRHYHYSPDGSVWINVRAVDTFSEATVMGKTGGLTIRLNMVVDVTETYTGTWVIIGGTGELANLHGQGTVSGPKTAVGYSGQVHFDP